jgi:acetyl esterase/lipase
MTLLVAAFAILMTPKHLLLDLWPSGPPDGWRRTDSEVSERDSANGFDIVRNVSHPTLELFLTDRAKPRSPFVIVCPGGGYQIEAIEHEGKEIAERLNSDGFNAAILKYRLPNRVSDHPLHKAPLQDAQRAIRLLRQRAPELGIDPGCIGILGFSAGGHLAAATANAPEATYEGTDKVDVQSPKPAFTVLIYPAYLDTNGRPELNPEIQLTSSAPPAFVLQTMDDPYEASAFAYALACRKAGVPVELHMFPHGGHGYGIRTKEPGLSGWMELLAGWLTRSKFVAP